MRILQKDEKMEANVVHLALLFSLIAGLSTGLGSLFSFFIKDLKQAHLSLFMGFSAGVMVQISFVELLFSSIADSGFLYANLCFFMGALTIAAIDLLIPHEYKEERLSEDERNHNKLARTGLLVSLGIAIHNFPEGLVTLFGTMKDPSLGFMLLLAISLHNIPEGISVAFPIYYATKNRKKAFTWSFMSGIAEPVGALVGYTLLYPFITPYILSITLAFVAGIMVFISLDELLPVSLKYGKEHLCIASLFLGMIMMTLILFLLK